MFSLWQYQRLAEGTGWERDFTRYAQNTWRRTIRARGGYWTGDFVITGLSTFQYQNLYSVLIGKRIVEKSWGRTTWEGEIIGLSMTLNGVTNEQSMDSELWHNKVKCQYTFPSAVDVQQGGVLAYVAPGGDDGFQDSLQDFSDWEVLAGDATHEIRITNDDGTQCSGYMGEATQTLNPDDSIWLFKDRGRGVAGINGDTVAKTPLTYIVSDIDNSGTQQATDWSENVGSSDIYGESQYIEVLPEECYLTAAEASRDRRLEDFAYPRSQPVGGLSSDEPQSSGNQMTVTCAGYVFSMNRRFYETNMPPLAISTQIGTLVTASEYVTDGGILVNDTINSSLTGAAMTFKLWDGIEGLALLGDSSANRYRCGVHADRLFTYDLAETTALYEWRSGQLRYATGQLVPPTLIMPDIIVRLEAPLVVAPPDASWQTVTQVYITEVEYVAPNGYRLVTDAGDVLVGGF